MHLEHCEAYIPERLLLKHEIVLKDIPNSKTGVNPKWIKELQQEKAIELEI